MRLVYKITLTFAIPLVLTLALWGWLSYRTMEKKIHADTDLILKDYSDDIIIRKLSGKELPDSFNGAYNTYYIREVSQEYAHSNPAVTYEETEVHLADQQEFANSRVRKQIFMDKEGDYFEIAVSVPVFEQEVLVEHVLWWTVLLFAVLLIALLVIGFSVLHFSMKPLEELLEWMDEYVPGVQGKPVPSDSDIIEFRRLAAAASMAVERFEREYEERRIFIGNASHELQTPLAACGNRLEMILQRTDLNDELAGEIVKVHRSLQNLIRLNKTLLLLTKIENDRFPEMADMDMNVLIDECVALNSEIYAHKDINVSVEDTGKMILRMNEQMAHILVNNLVKNAFVHTPAGGRVSIVISSDVFKVINTGNVPLDEKYLFRRFYQPGGRKEGSTGLGLALAYSVCSRNGFGLSYAFEGGSHIFTVRNAL